MVGAESEGLGGGEDERGVVAILLDLCGRPRGHRLVRRMAYSATATALRRGLKTASK